MKTSCTSYLILLAAFSLTGCAGQMAYRDGKSLVEQNQVEAGLLKFQEAAAQDPQNLEYRKAFLQTRERATYGWLEQADRFISQEDFEEAKIFYQRVIALDPKNDRARAGLARFEMNNRHNRLIADARLSMEKNNFATAKEKLAIILKENPENSTAVDLQREIAEKSTQPPIESALASAYRKPITIEFTDASLKQIFAVISHSSGLNFLFDKDVKTDQKTSIFLKNTTVDSAVHFVLLTNQLEQQVLDANTILIYPNTAAKQKDYQEMIVRSFFLTNADAKTVAATLKTMLKSRDIVIDEKLNMVMLRDSPEAIKLAEKLVALHDVPEPEVMLEVEILEIKRTRLLELGIQWPSSLTLTPLPSVAGSALTVRDLATNINGSTISAGLGPVHVNARKEDGDANLLANPRIRARNHEKAKILIGERVPNITTTATSSGFVSESVNYLDVGLKLDVEPTIYLNNDVAIKISMEVSSVTNQIRTQSGTLAYQIGTRTASTVLRLKDGENQVLAGLINDEDRRTGNKIPGLGDLPILGRLFGSTTDDNQKTEIVLSITPHLIRNIQRPDFSSAEFRSGTDSSFRSRPEAVVAPAVATLRTSAGPLPTPIIGPNGNPILLALQNAASNTGLAVPGSSPMPSMDTTLNVGGGQTDVTSNLAQVQLQGPKQAKLGETFSVLVIIQSDQPISGVPITIGYNSQVLQVVEIAEGTFLKQNGATTGFTSRIDANGQIQLTTTRNGNTGATSQGTLATLTFRSLAPLDTALIQVLTVNPTGPANRPISTTSPVPFSIQIQS